jgi:MFS family permease
MNANIKKQNPMTRVLSLRDFRLLFAGTATSLLGDQFTLIATPWLVLQLTQDPMALGIVLALEGIPRALFMLLGGAITDRFSPRVVMLTASILRFMLTALLAVLVFLNITQIWMIYLIGLIFGIIAGFAVPAENSIVPMLVKEDDLQAGNSIIMGVTQLAGFVGPTVAGLLIGAFASSNMGIILAFVIDAATFVVSASALWLIHSGTRSVDQGTKTEESLWKSIQEGIQFLWADRPLRLMFIVLMSVNFLLMGPLMVGIPVLADRRLPEGAAAFGLLMSAFAGGNLVGFLVAGSLPHPPAANMSSILVTVIGSFGVVVGALGFLNNTWVDFSLLALTGLGNGYIAILLFTWIQTRTPKERLGRMMSLVTFSSTGLVPISQALAGVISKWDLTMLFVLAGSLVLLVTIWMARHPDLKAFGASLANSPLEAGQTP